MGEQSYVVRGFWPFPLDMLRHDSSAAATAEDQCMIDRLSGDHAPDRAAFYPVDIKLTGPFRPNTARWESFGWAVPGDLEHQWIQDDRQRRRQDREILDRALSKLTPDELRVVRAHFGSTGDRDPAQPDYESMIMVGG